VAEASPCKNCGKCLKICPQIPVELKKVSWKLGGLPTKIPLLSDKLCGLFGIKQGLFAPGVGYYLKILAMERIPFSCLYMNNQE
jgi:ferredoxin